jgi:uncharacterized phage protein (TIGR01671 family)
MNLKVTEMNRELKFRAWHKGFKKMTPEFDLGATKLFYLKSNGLTSSINDNVVELMQFTGLKDKNEKEIYEGDIVKYRYKVTDIGDEHSTGETIGIDYLIGVVYFSSIYNAWGFNNINKDLKYLDPDWLTGGAKHHCFLGFRPKDYEVIGNIYENEYLLK